MNNDFGGRISKNIDKDKFYLLSLQDEIERKGITRENILSLTKDLSKEQKIKLKNMYFNQIEKLESSLQNYKTRIIKIRSELKFN